MTTTKKKSAVIGFLVIFFVFFSVFLYSCSSTGLRIPGEERKILENLAAEYYHLAEGYLEQKNYKKAMECYDFAMRDNSIRQQSYYKKGYCAAMAKEWDVAQEIYSDLLLQDSENINLALSLAYIMSQQGKLEEAVDIYKELSDKNPQDQNIAENCISLFIALEQFDKARDELSLFSTNFPDATEKISEFEKQLENATKTDEEQDKTPDDGLPDKTEETETENTDMAEDVM